MTDTCSYTSSCFNTEFLTSSLYATTLTNQTVLSNCFDLRESTMFWRHCPFTLYNRFYCIAGVLLAVACFNNSVTKSCV